MMDSAAHGWRRRRAICWRGAAGWVRWHRGNVHEAWPAAVEPCWSRDIPGVDVGSVFAWVPAKAAAAVRGRLCSVVPHRHDGGRRQHEQPRALRRAIHHRHTWLTSHARLGSFVAASARHLNAVCVELAPRAPIPHLAHLGEAAEDDLSARGLQPDGYGDHRLQRLHRINTAPHHSSCVMAQLARSGLRYMARQNHLGRGIATAPPASRGRAAGRGGGTSSLAGCEVGGGS